MLNLSYLAIYTAILWLAASLWLSWGGEQYVLWMALIPAVYVVLLQILRE
jgi:hypothetical protein